MKQYIEIIFSYPKEEPETKERLIATLSQNDFETFWETDAGLKAYIEQDKYQQKQNPLAFLENISSNISYNQNTVKDQNWNRIWEENFQPVIIGNELYIRAPFHEENPVFHYEILIEPKMSFGTGHHLSTYLMLETLVNCNLKDQTILDMGCGTAILSILASKKQASYIKGVDNSDWALENAKENTWINNSKNTEIVLGDATSLKEEESYDYILANINRNVLLNDIPTYTRHLKPNGILMISGLYNKDKDEIHQLAVKNQLRMIEYKEKEDWIAISYKKM